MRSILSKQMNATQWFFLILILILLLTGCTTTEVRVVERNHYVLVTPGGQYMHPLPLPEPPEIETYLQANMDQREDILTRELIRHYQLLASCNNDKAAIEALWSKQKTALDQLNEEERQRVELLKKTLENRK